MLCVALFFGNMATPVWAGVFSVTPVRVFMTVKDRGVAISLSNEGDTVIALQADISVWRQKSDGTDELVLTEDLILSPPILKLAPNARQVVRLALLTPPDATRQLTYRMLVREVPEATAPKEGMMEIPIALVLSIPVFITPEVAKRELHCTLLRTDAVNVSASCNNTGTAYAQLREITLLADDKPVAKFQGGSYILPGATKQIALKAEQPIAAGAVTLQLVFDDSKSESQRLSVP